MVRTDTRPNTFMARIADILPCLTATMWTIWWPADCTTRTAIIAMITAR